VCHRCRWHSSGVNIFPYLLEHREPLPAQEHSAKDSRYKDEQRRPAETNLATNEDENGDLNDRHDHQNDWKDADWHSQATCMLLRLVVDGAGLDQLRHLDRKCYTNWQCFRPINIRLSDRYLVHERL
jgi:hypothetical protein